jgi:hypothetical protein
MKPTIPVIVAKRPLALVAGEVDEDMNVDALLEESGKAALHAVDFGDGGTQEIAYHMEALRLAMFAIVVAIQDLGSDIRGGHDHD